MASSESGVDASESDRAASRASSGPPAQVPAIEAAGLSGWLLRTIALLLLLASLVGRSLAPALRGARAGIGSFIERTQFAGELLTQLAVFAGAMIAVRLAFATLRERRLGVMYRLVSVPASATIITLVVASSARQLDLGLGVTLGLSAATLAFAASVPAIMAVPTRAAGFVLALSAAATFAHLLAGFLAMRASERALLTMFSMARGVATLGFALDVASLLVAGAWIAAKRWRPAAIVGTLLIGAALFWLGVRRTAHSTARRSGKCSPRASWHRSRLNRRPWSPRCSGTGRKCRRCSRRPWCSRRDRDRLPSQPRSLSRYSLVHRVKSPRSASRSRCPHCSLR